MDELITWLRAQLDDDERVARAASKGPWAKDRADSVYAKETSVVTRPPAPEANRPGWLEPFDYVVPPDSEGSEGIEPADAEHIARWDPARVLAEVEAKRCILDEHPHEAAAPWGTTETTSIGCVACHDHGEGTIGKGWCQTVRLLSQPYAGREGWREEWRAEPPA